MSGSVSKAYYYFVLSLRSFEENLLQQNNIVNNLDGIYRRNYELFQEETQKYNSLVQYLRLIYNNKAKKMEYQEKYNETKIKNAELKQHKSNLKELEVAIVNHKNLLESYKKEIVMLKEKLFQCTSLNGEKLLTVIELRERITELGWVTLYNSNSLSLDTNNLSQQININYEVKKISLSSSSSVLIDTTISRSSTPTNIPVCVTPTSIKQTPSVDLSNTTFSNEMTLVPQRLGFDLDLSEFKEDNEDINEELSNIDKDSENKLKKDVISSEENSEFEGTTTTDLIISPEASEIIMRGIRYCLSLWIMRMDEEIVLNIDRLRWLIRNSINFYSSYFTHPELDIYKEDQAFDDFISRINEEEIIMALLVPAVSPVSQAIASNNLDSLTFSDLNKSPKIETKHPTESFDFSQDLSLKGTTSSSNSTIQEAATLISTNPETTPKIDKLIEKSPALDKKNTEEKIEIKREKVEENSYSYEKFNRSLVESNSLQLCEEQEGSYVEQNQSPKPKTWRHISKNSPLRRKLSSVSTDEVDQTNITNETNIISLSPQVKLKEEQLGHEIDEIEEENQTNYVLSRCPYTKKLIVTKKITQNSNLLNYYQGKIFGTALLAWLALNKNDERLTTMKLNYSKKLLEKSEKDGINYFYEEVKSSNNIFEDNITPSNSDDVDNSSQIQNSEEIGSLGLRIIPRPPPLPTSWPPIPYNGKTSFGQNGVTSNGAKLPPNSSKFRMVQVSPVTEIKNSVWEMINSSDTFKGFSPSHIFFDLKDSFSLKSKVTSGALAKNNSTISRAGFLSALSTELLGKKSGLKKTSDDTSSVHSRSSDKNDKKKIISILDPQRSQNISIMLAKFSAGGATSTKKSSSASLIWLVDCIINYKYNELGLININMLMSYTPSVEDQSKVIKWIDDLIVSNLDSITSKIRRKSSKFSKEDMDKELAMNNLANTLPPKQINSSTITTNVIHALNHLGISKADQFLYIISKIPYYNHILDIISFKLTLENQLSELTVQCESLSMLCEELLDSEKLKFFLKCVRDMYNLLMDVIYNDKEDDKDDKEDKKEENKIESDLVKKEYYIDGVSIDSLLKLTTIKLPQPVKLTPPPAVSSHNFSSFSSRKSITSSVSSNNLNSDDKPTSPTPSPVSSSSTSSASSSSTAFTYICSRIHLSMPQASPLNIREDLSNLDKFAKGWSSNRLNNEIVKLVNQVKEVINMASQFIEKNQSDSIENLTINSIPPIVTILMDVHPKVCDLIDLYNRTLKRLILTSRHFAQPLSLPLGTGSNTFNNTQNILPIQLPPIPPSINKYIDSTNEENEKSQMEEEKQSEISPTFEAMSTFFDSMPTVEMNTMNGSSGIDDSDIKNGSLTWWENLFSPANSIQLPNQEESIPTPEIFFATISTFCDSLDQVQSEIVRKIKRLESTKNK